MKQMRKKPINVETGRCPALRRGRTRIRAMAKKANIPTVDCQLWMNTVAPSKSVFMDRMAALILVLIFGLALAKGGQTMSAWAE